MEGGAKPGVAGAGTSLGVVKGLQNTEWERDGLGES